MSFGFSVGDFVLLIQLAKTTYKNCVEAGVEYNEIAREIRSLHSILRPLRDEAQKPDSPLFRQDQGSAAELLTAIDGCKHILEDFQILLAKYEGLSTNGEAMGATKKLWHRFRFSTKIEQLGTVRGKLIAYTSTISVLLDGVQLRATGRVEEKIDDISVEMKSGFASLRKVICAMAIKDRAEQRGGSTLSLLSLSTYAEDDKEVWREFRRQLIAQGIRSKDLDRYKDSLQAYMLKLHQSGILDEVQEVPGQVMTRPWWKKQAFAETVNSLPALQSIEEGSIVPSNQLEAKALSPPPPPDYGTDETKAAGWLASSPLPPPFQQNDADDHDFAHDSGINIGDAENVLASNEKHTVDLPNDALPRPPNPTITEYMETVTTDVKRSQRPSINRSSKFEAPIIAPTVADGALQAISQAARSLPENNGKNEEGLKIGALASPKGEKLQAPAHAKFPPSINTISGLPGSVNGEHVPGISTPKSSPPRPKSPPREHRSSTSSSSFPGPRTKATKSTLLIAPSSGQNLSGPMPSAEDEPSLQHQERLKTDSSKIVTFGNSAPVPARLAEQSMVVTAKKRSQSHECSSEDSYGYTDDHSSCSDDDLYHPRSTEIVEIPQRSPTEHEKWVRGKGAFKGYMVLNSSEDSPGSAYDHIYDSDDDSNHHRSTKPDRTHKEEKKWAHGKRAFPGFMVLKKEISEGKQLGSPNAYKSKDTRVSQDNHDISNEIMDERSQHDTSGKRPFQAYVESASDSDPENLASTDLAPVPTREASAPKRAPQKPVREEPLERNRESSGPQLDPFAHDDRRRRDSSDFEEERGSTLFIVSPPEEVKKLEERKPRGILRPPRERFPEDVAPIREGVAPLKDAKIKGIPRDARWTKISRRMVIPEALEAGGERYEAREDFVIVLRVLTKEEVQGYAVATKQIRDARKQK